MNLPFSRKKSRQQSIQSATSEQLASSVSQIPLQLNAMALEERIVLTAAVIDASQDASADPSGLNSSDASEASTFKSAEHELKGQTQQVLADTDFDAVTGASALPSSVREGLISSEIETVEFSTSLTSQVAAPAGTGKTAPASSGSNTAPEITSGSGATDSVTVDENETTVLAVTATDADFDNVTFSITGGTDSDDFTIDANTGVLSFVSAPDFELPADSDTDNVYEVEITVSDGNGGEDVQTITVTVSDVTGFNDAETFDVDFNTLSFVGGVLTGGVDTEVGAEYTYTNIITVDGTRIDATVTVVAITSGIDLVDNDDDGSTASLLAPTISGSNTGQVDFRVDFFDEDGNVVILTNFRINSYDIDGNGLEYVEYGGFQSIELATNTDLTTSSGGDDRIRITGSSEYGGLSTDDEGRIQAVFGPTSSFDISMGLSSANGSARLFGTGFEALDFASPQSFDSPTVNTLTTADTTPELTGTIGNSVLGVDEDFTVTVNSVTYTEGDGNLSVSGLNWTLVIPSGNALTSGTYEVLAEREYDTIGATFPDQTSDELTVIVNSAPTIISNGGGDTATLSIDEGETDVTTAIATDIDAGDSVTYSISGTDAASFSIDEDTGALTFNSAQDYEAGTTSFVVVVTATDSAGLTDTQTITINLANVAPDITSNSGGATATVSVDEGDTEVTTVVATDPVDDAPEYSITGGADSALFEIDDATGELTFATAPDYEGGQTSFVVEVTADDGTATDTQTITVNLNNVGPDITSNGGGATASVSVAEGETEVTTVVATDPVDDAPEYSITGGADSALFEIDDTTGELTFATAPDFEDGQTTFVVEVTADDGTTTDSQTITVTLTNEAPVITSNGGGATATVSVDEGDTEVTTVVATDPVDDAPEYSITGGADSALFTIDDSTGELSFLTAPDYEGGQTSFVVEVTADDGTATDVQTITVNLNNVGPDITSNGGGATASVSVAEGETEVTTVVATDPVDDAPEYSITGGDDSALFTIDDTTGELSFLSAPDFEGGQTSFEVEVTADDGTATDVQTITVNLTNENEPPVITSNGGGSTATVSVDEGDTAVTTVTANDSDSGDTVTFSISGTDAGLFSIDEDTGELTFDSAPDFEGGQTSFEVVVTATDGSSATDTQTITINLANVAPDITSNGGGSTATVSVAEGTTDVTTVVATDPVDDAPEYSITGGADSALFTIDDTTGELSFISAPDYDPSNSSFIVEVTADDGTATDVQTITVNVTDGNSPPTITSNGGGSTATVNVDEGDNTVTTVTSTDPDAGDSADYSLSGADASDFSITSGGVLTFNSTPDFEAGPTEYTVIVTVTDGDGATDSQTLTINIDNVGPDITSDGGGATATVGVLEGTTAVTTVSATDPVDNAPTYSISGGADGALFTINGSSGALAFITAPDFEGGQTSYEVEVTATDGDGATDSQTITVNLANENEPPTITSNGGGNSATVNVDEGDNTVTRVTTSDPDTGDKVTLALSGSDADKFSISSNDTLSFNNTPDFEAGQTSFSVTVTATDESGATDTQTITIRLTNVAPDITSDGGGSTATVSVLEGETDVTNVDATDPVDNAPSYSITGGDDASRFSINGNTGALTFKNAPDFEGGQTSFEVEVTADDGNGGTDRQTITVNLINVNEPPEANDIDLGDLPENEDIIITTQQLLNHASDPDGDPLTVTALTLNDPETGTLIDNGDGTWTFRPADEYNGPVNFTYTVSDGEETASADLDLSLFNTNDPPEAGDVDLGITPEDTGIIITEEDLLANSSDPDGDTLTVTNLTLNNPGTGTLVDNGDGTWTFTPNDVAEDTDISFTFVVSDGEETDSANATLEIQDIVPPVVEEPPVEPEPEPQPEPTDPGTPEAPTDTGGDDGPAPADTTGPVTDDTGDGAQSLESSFQDFDFELYVDAGIPDYFTEVEAEFEIGIPSNAFGTRGDDGTGGLLEIADIEATLADGTPLPQWITFDAETMTFQGVMPASIGNDVVIKVKVIDTAGNEAETEFRIIKSNQGAVGIPSNDQPANDNDQSADDGDGTAEPETGEDAPQPETESDDPPSDTPENEQPAAHSFNANAQEFGSHKFLKDSARLLELV